MFRVIVLFAVFIKVLVYGVPTDEFFKHCTKLNTPAISCCTMDVVQELVKTRDPIIKECEKLPPPPSCDQAICLGTNYGYASPDGTLDKAKLTKLIEDDFNGYPEMAAVVKDMCINGDVSKYGMPSMCDLTKVEVCARIQVLGHCNSWNNEGSCSGIEDAAKNCLKIFSN